MAGRASAQGRPAPGERQEPLPGAGLVRPAVLEVLAGDVEPGDRITLRVWGTCEVLGVQHRPGAVVLSISLGAWPTRFTLPADSLIEVVR